MGFDFADVEHALCRIPDVSAARIVVGPDQRPVEVHVLASPHKHAKQIVRDIQSVALASFGLDIDRRVVSVVQLEEPDEGRAAAPNGATVPRAVPAGHDATRAVRPRVDPKPARGVTRAAMLTQAEPGAATPSTQRGHEADVTPMTRTLAGTDLDRPDPHDAAGDEAQRVAVEGVQLTGSALELRAEVTLRRDRARASGAASGLASTGAAVRLAAQATMSALRILEPSALRADVESTSVITMGERRVALAVVVLLDPPHEQVMTGAVVVGQAGDLDATARAVLSAVNRRLLSVRPPRP